MCCRSLAGRITSESECAKHLLNNSIRVLRPLTTPAVERSSNMKKHLRSLNAFAIAALLLAIMPSAASATTSPTQCDGNSPPKYSCAYITYSIYSSGGQNYYRVDVRYFKGAIDGGAQRWQIEYYNDYRWNGSAWVLSYGSGSTGWWTNYSMPGFYSSLGPPNAQTGGALSQVKFRYFEVTPQYPSGYYWPQGPYTFYVT